MYAYYGLSVCGSHIQKYLGWKRYLTQVQIVRYLLWNLHFYLIFIKIQFVLVIIQSTINLLSSCHFPKIFDIVYLLDAVFLLVLFLRFYSGSYVKEKKDQKDL